MAAATAQTTISVGIRASPFDPTAAFSFAVRSVLSSLFNFAQPDLDTLLLEITQRFRILTSFILTEGAEFVAAR